MSRIQIEQIRQVRINSKSWALTGPTGNQYRIIMIGLLYRAERGHDGQMGHLGTKSSFRAAKYAILQAENANAK